MLVQLCKGCKKKPVRQGQGKGMLGLRDTVGNALINTLSYSTHSSTVTVLMSHAGFAGGWGGGDCQGLQESGRPRRALRGFSSFASQEDVLPFKNNVNM